MPDFVLDRVSVRAVDRAAIEEYGLPGIVLMENAARALAHAALAMLAEVGAPAGPVLIVCGAGNNGGDGWALARHLLNSRVEVTVVPLGAPKTGTDAATNCGVARRMGVAETAVGGLEHQAEAALIVDAIFGTGLDRPVRAEAAAVIDWINASGRPVLAVDLPSGLDGDTGAVLGTAVRATRTVTFVGRKPGFDTPAARPYLGDVVVGDIGAPRELTERFGRPHEDASG